MTFSPPAPTPAATQQAEYQAASQQYEQSMRQYEQAQRLYQSNLQGGPGGNR